VVGVVMCLLNCTSV